MNPRPWGLVLDADVLLRSSVRDLFLYLAPLDVVDPIWSDQILDEVARNFPGGAERFRALHAALEAAFPDARKAGVAHRIATLTRTHAKDRHLLALAAEHEADLVSFNHKHFDREEARRNGVVVWAPDDALAQIILHRPSEARRAAERAYLRLSRPPVAWIDYAARIRADGMPRVADWIAELPEPRRDRVP